MKAGAEQYVSIIDAHVHIYSCFNLVAFLDAAYDNFRSQAQQHTDTDTFIGVLLLTETSRDHCFQQLQSYAEREKPIGHDPDNKWYLYPTSESCSLRARSDKGRELVVVAGRQIVAKEDLEVLALCTDATFRDGMTFFETVDRVWQAGALAAIPWGAGKWLGKRGALLTQLLERPAANVIFLGDNSGRPTFWRQPFHFQLADDKGIRILPGSDPLPFSSEYWRPGSFGFSINSALNPKCPADDLKRIIKDTSIPLQTYGQLESTYRFFRNQLAMQLRKRFSRKIITQ